MSPRIDPSTLPSEDVAAKQERLFLILAGIFIASLVAGNLIFQKFTSISVGFYVFNLSVGILPYPITFLVTDVISEIYGKRRADQVVLAGFAASIFVVVLILVADFMTATNWSPVDDPTFHKVFGLTPGAVFASMCAYLTAQFVDIRIFHFWKRLTKGKHLWLRNNGSTIFSQFIDTALVLALLCIFTDKITWSQYPELLENGFLFKVIVAALDTPVFYKVSAYLREQFDLEIGEEVTFAHTVRHEYDVEKPTPDNLET